MRYEAKLIESINLQSGVVEIIAELLVTGISFGVMSLFVLSIAWLSPKGQVGKFDYESLPGIRTPEPLTSREAWIVAHKKTSAGFTLLAVYFAAAGVGMMLAIASEVSMNVDATSLALLFLGFIWFIILMIIGSRAAARFNREQTPRQASQDTPG